MSLRTIIVYPETTLAPITTIGKFAGVCWGGNTDDDEKNYKRGMSCLKSNHGRTLEFVQIYLQLNGYSAKVIRELYTHISGQPTRLQASTRYIDYDNFDYIIPQSIKDNNKALQIYQDTLQYLKNGYTQLLKEKIPIEDASMLLPLGMSTQVVLRTNLRNLIDMSHQRLCSRAFWEYRRLMNDIMNALKDQSSEWDYIINEYFKPKCEVLGYCPEEKSCGRKENRQHE